MSKYIDFISALLDYNLFWKDMDWTSDQPIQKQTFNGFASFQNKIHRELLNYDETLKETKDDYKEIYSRKPIDKKALDNKFKRFNEETWILTSGSVAGMLTLLNISRDRFKIFIQHMGKGSTFETKDGDIIKTDSKSKSKRTVYSYYSKVNEKADFFILLRNMNMHENIIKSNISELVDKINAFNASVSKERAKRGLGNHYNEKWFKKMYKNTVQLMHFDKWPYDDEIFEQNMYKNPELLFVPVDKNYAMKHDQKIAAKSEDIKYTHYHETSSSFTDVEHWQAFIKVSNEYALKIIMYPFLVSLIGMTAHLPIDFVETAALTEEQIKKTNYPITNLWKLKKPTK